MKGLVLSGALALSTLAAVPCEARAAASDATETIASYNWCYDSTHHCRVAAHARARQLEGWGYCTKVTVTPCGGWYKVYYAHH
jgi:hypothetical protein